ncbi:MAG: permease [candidate division Zixibacteria bacterium]|nr:permease [candidate division Zixibacteria bacterium]
MFSFLLKWAEATWQMLVSSAFLFVVGLLLAGFLWLLMNEKNIRRLIQGGGIRGVFKAALLGIPLPLCSWSVLPVASQLRKSGARKAGVMSFVIATPESGVDSIALTYSLTDPVLTVARPVTAFLTALLAGVVETFFKDDIKPAVFIGNRSNGDCCGATSADNLSQKSIIIRILSSINYAFNVLLKDLAPYLMLGFVLAGLVGALLGDNPTDIPSILKTGWLGYLGAIVIGLPLYICASSSTPLAAVFLASGFSPGAILVFLMAGPATNIATLVVLKNILGNWSTVRYLTAIVVVSITGGVITDWIYGILNIPVLIRSQSTPEEHSPVSILMALGLTAFIIFYSIQWVSRKLAKKSLK